MVASWRYSFTEGLGLAHLLSQCKSDDSHSGSMSPRRTMCLPQFKLRDLRVLRGETNAEHFVLGNFDFEALLLCQAHVSGIHNRVVNAQRQLECTGDADVRILWREEMLNKELQKHLWHLDSVQRNRLRANTSGAVGSRSLRHHVDVVGTAKQVEQRIRRSLSLRKSLEINLGVAID